MESILFEWLTVLLWGGHIIAASMWIGDSLLFMWIDSQLSPDPQSRQDVTGVTWLLHGGGYYQLEKRRLALGRVPPTLRWFWLEATSTWISPLNWLVLSLVIVLGAGVQLIMLVGFRAARWTAAAATAHSPAGSAASTPPFIQVRMILVQRCAVCHSEGPSMPGVRVAPGGVKMDMPERSRPGSSDQDLRRRRENDAARRHHRNHRGRTDHLEALGGGGGSSEVSPVSQLNPGGAVANGFSPRRIRTPSR